MLVALDEATADAQPLRPSGEVLDNQLSSSASRARKNKAPQPHVGRYLTPATAEALSM